MPLHAGVRGEGGGMDRGGEGRERGGGEGAGWIGEGRGEREEEGREGCANNAKRVYT